MFFFFPQDLSPAHRRHVKMVVCVFRLHDRIHAASEYKFWDFEIRITICQEAFFLGIYFVKISVKVKYATCS